MSGVGPSLIYRGVSKEKRGVRPPSNGGKQVPYFVGGTLPPYFLKSFTLPEGVRDPPFSLECNLEEVHPARLRRLDTWLQTRLVIHHMKGRGLWLRPII